MKFLEEPYYSNNKQAEGSCCRGGVSKQKISRPDTLVGENLKRIIDFEFKEKDAPSIWASRLENKIDNYREVAKQTSGSNKLTSSSKQRNHFSREFKIAVIKAERLGMSLSAIRKKFRITSAQICAFRKWFKTEQRRSVTPLKTVNYLTFGDTLTQASQHDGNKNFCYSLDHPEPETIQDLKRITTSSSKHALRLSPGGMVVLKKARQLTQV